MAIRSGRNLRNWPKYAEIAPGLIARFGVELDPTSFRGLTRLRPIPRRRRLAALSLERLEDLTLLSSSILGTVYNDQNDDGQRQAGESGVAGETLYLDLNHDKTLGTTSRTFTEASPTLAPTPGELGAVAGGDASLLSVQGLPSQIESVSVSMDLENNGTLPIIVGLTSPTGIAVGDLPILFEIQPGEHFVGTFDPTSTNLVTLASSPPTSGVFQPQQAFSLPPAHIFDGSPNGDWGLVFNAPDGDFSNLVLASWSLTFQVSEPTATTDANGNYEFDGVAPGTYQVGLVTAPGDLATNPTGKTPEQTVTVGTQAATGINFGVQPSSTVTPQTFYLANPATAWGQPVTLEYTLANEGNGNAPAFNVDLVLSTDGGNTASDPVVGTFHVTGIPAQGSTTGSVTITLPATPPAGFVSLATSYIGLRIDPDHLLARNNPAPASDHGAGTDFAQLGADQNSPVTSGAGIQQDPTIAVDPTNPLHVVTAYLDYSLLTTGYAGIGIGDSTDGGKTWTFSSIPLPAGFDQGAANPVVAFDAKGRVYVSFMAATFLGPTLPDVTQPDSTQRQLGFTSNNGIFVASSPDGGATWNNPTTVDENTWAGGSAPQVYFDVQPTIAIDTYKTLPNGHANPNFGNVYVAWSRFYPSGEFPGQPDSTGGSDVMFAVSTDTAQTWTTRLGPTVNGITRSVIQDPDWDDNGTLSAGIGYVLWPDISVGTEGEIYVSTFGADDFTVYRSFDAGVSFIAPDRIAQTGVPFFDVVPYPTFGNDGFRTLPVRDIVADPSHPGRVYAVDVTDVDNEVLGGIVDTGEIIFAVSNDFGQTWNPQFQVGKETTNLSTLPPGENDFFLSALNDDDGGNTTQFDGFPQINNEVLSAQAMPSISVDAQGRITVIWYDSRLDPTQQAMDVYGTVSTDGGQTFSANFRVTDTTFDPNAGAFNSPSGATTDFLGDHIGLATANGVAYAVWTDTRNGTQQIYSQTFSTIAPPTPPVGRFDPNQTPAMATNLGEVAAQTEIPRLTVAPGDDDWFNVQAGATGELVATVTANSGPGGELLAELTDASGNVLPATVTNILDSSGNVTGQQIVYASVAGQTYLIHVRSGDESTIPYTLFVGSLTGDLGTSVQGTVAGSIDPGGQSVYRLQAAVTGSITLTLTPGNDFQGDLSLQALSPDGQTVLAAGDPAGTSAGTPQSITLSVTLGEVILIAVADADGDSSGTFSLQYVNMDQYEASGISTLFFPTDGDPASVAVANLSKNGVPDILVSSVDSSDTLQVLDGNGDGTFQAVRQFDVGPGLANGLTAGYRQIGIADLTGSGVPDVIVPNFRGGNISVLLGNGDGTFQSQRQFDAVTSPDSLVTGDFSNNGKTDVAVLENFGQLGAFSSLAILMGRGDGTFLPPVLYQTVFNNGAGPMVVGDFTGNGVPDIIVFSKNEPEAELFPGKGDGTFGAGEVFHVGEDAFAAQAVDLNGDGKLDLVTTGTNTGNVYVMLGNGNGTFQTPQAFNAMPITPGTNVGVYDVAVADFGGPTTPGVPDGVPDLIVTAQATTGTGPAEVIMLPGLVDANGNYAGFGDPVVLANIGTAGKIAVADLNDDGVPDIVAADKGGVTVIYGQPPAITPNDTPSAARALGSAPHVVLQPQAIVAGFEDAYFTYTVPTEAASGAGDEVIDFSALFQDTQGAGLTAVVTDPHGTILGQGDRFRVVAAQGEVLTIHVFGQSDLGGNLGAGVYTLDIDVLPQVASVEAQPMLPGGPTDSLVVTFQGDRLDPATAQNPANYEVIYLGTNTSASQGGQVIPVASLGDAQPAIYDPSTNVQVGSGLTYATAVRQTVTLLFAKALPAGNYEVVFSPAIQAAPLNDSEIGQLAEGATLGGHPLVSTGSGIVAPGASVEVNNLVAPVAPVKLSNLNVLPKGTPFLSQLTDDLNALLQSAITANGDDPGITEALNDQIFARFAPLFAARGSQAPSIALIWLDPISLDVESPSGSAVSYSLASNAVANGLSQSYVDVGGNVEVVVLANATGTFNVNVANVGATARGGAVLLSDLGASELEFTSDLRSDVTSFQLDLGVLSGEEGGIGGPSGGGIVGAPSSSGTGSTSTASLTSLVTALTTSVILGPTGAENTGSALTGAETGAAAEVTGSSGTFGGAPVATPTTSGNGTSSDSHGDVLEPTEIFNGNLRAALKSTLSMVKKLMANKTVLSTVKGVIGAVGAGTSKTPLNVLKALRDALSPPRSTDRPTQADPPAAKDAAPAATGVEVDALDLVLGDPKLDGEFARPRALPQWPAAEPAEIEAQVEQPSPSQVYFSATLLAAGLFRLNGPEIDRDRGLSRRKPNLRSGPLRR